MPKQKHLPIDDEPGFNRLTGTVAKLLPDKGFGFIMAEGGKEYFFHRSSFRDQIDWATLKVGQSLSFMPTHSDRGLRAEDVAHG